MTALSLIGTGVLITIAAVMFLLDMIGRAEIIKSRWPRIWGWVTSRPLIILLLLVSIAVLDRDFKDAAAIAPAPVIRVTSPPPPTGWEQKPQTVAGASTRPLNSKRSAIQRRIAEFINSGITLRDEWVKVIPGTPELQHAKALAIGGWHKAVEDYLKSIPRGDIYLARFRNQVRPSSSYPVGISFDYAGSWDVLMSDLARLNEFLQDPELGEP
jgi:hypothetical protein